MTKIDIFSGFLGAGKTTLIKKLIKEAYTGEKLVLIENEFGEIGIDGGFMQDAGIEVTEMNQGCICCSLVGDFTEALKKVMETYAPDRIIIEPTGVGKLSDVIAAVRNADIEGMELNSFTTVADAKKCKMYIKNFGEFYNNQIENANSIVLSRTAGMSEDAINACVALLREHNATASIITTDWAQLDGKLILETMEKKNTLEAELKKLTEEEDVCPVCGHHHDDDEDEEEHEHHHHHHDDEDEEEHEHHHHHHDDEDEDEHEHHHHHHDEDEDEDEHEHHHHHHDDEEDEHEHHHHDGECCCGHDHGHGHHHHHADEVFQSYGEETAKKFTKEEIADILTELENNEKYGVILRAKGIVENKEGGWIHFDFVPGQQDIRDGSAGVIGRLCVIGSKIKEDAIKALIQK